MFKYQLSLCCKKCKTRIVWEELYGISGILQRLLRYRHDFIYLLLVRPLEVACRIDFVLHSHAVYRLDNLKILFAYLLFSVDEIPDAVGSMYCLHCHIGVVCVCKKPRTVSYTASDSLKVLRMQPDKDGIQEYEGDFFNVEGCVSPVTPTDRPIFRKRDKILELVYRKHRFLNHFFVFGSPVKPGYKRGDAQLVELVLRKFRPVLFPFTPNADNSFLCKLQMSVVFNVEERREAFRYIKIIVLHLRQCTEVAVFGKLDSKNAVHSQSQRVRSLESDFSPF